VVIIVTLSSADYTHDVNMNPSAFKETIWIAYKSTNPKSFWEFVRSKRGANSIPDEVHLGKTKATGEQVSSLFASHFSSVYKDPQFTANTLSEGWEWDVSARAIRRRQFGVDISAICQFDDVHFGAWPFRRKLIKEKNCKKYYKML